jgi:hypothetical protein
MTAWRSFAEQGDMKELAIPRVKLQSHGRNTWSAAAGKIIQETAFPSFVKKGALLFNTLSECVRNGSKLCAKAAIKKVWYNVI